ncbi:pilus assembly protein TadG-related protein [Oricola cellulosilytica]|uniref:Putative Flp pilus-assembly TadG-like N-terminal domain-containing protein n=1 Tax=Oricola cellulosilytica TaxID=1429082 RepID=A0A4R0PBN5_9HYPH|nr:pilus assembly protein TadG-related protein [Oricola cellulosilytica]TCD13451.1 hypothetical protein E0D97_13305 [Oricola cellulosilytica]
MAKTRMIRKFLETRGSLRQFLKCNNGNFGITLAVLSLPVLAAVGLAVDYARLQADNRNLQQSVDAAALAAVVPQGKTDAERSLIASDFLEHNFEGNFVAPSVAVSTVGGYRRVTVSANTALKTSLMNVVGINNVDHGAKAVAGLRSLKNACVLALNTTEDDTINMWGSSAKIVANCDVQSNSSSPSFAMRNKSNETSTAKKFCTVGGYTGTRFSPLPETGCDPMVDPYTELPVPSVSGCTYKGHKISGGIVSLNPGVYCGGLEIKGGTVTFKPGVYVMKNGPLKIGANAAVTGEQVTFYLYGKNAVMDMGGGAQTLLSAPMTGDYAGLLVVQHPGAAAGATSSMSGGSDTRLIGVFYLPTQKLSIGGSGQFGALSPFMGVVANKVELFGNGTVVFNHDYESAGYGNIALPGTPVAYLIE